MSEKQKGMTVVKAGDSPTEKAQLVTVTKSFADFKGMIETIEEVMHNFIDTKTGYWLGRTYKELQKTEKALNEKIDGLLKMYGTEDEVKKTFSVDPKTMPANYARYEKAFMDLMKEETEVSVYKMNVNDVIRRNPDFRFRGSWFVILEDVFTGELDDNLLQ